ncbi:uncharacterized protein Gasu_65300, partial [Galdieria sulphuraria]
GWPPVFSIGPPILPPLPLIPSPWQLPNHNCPSTFRVAPLQFGPQSFLPLSFPHGNFKITIAHPHFELTPLFSIGPNPSPTHFPPCQFPIHNCSQPSSTSNWPLLSPHPHTP